MSINNKPSTINSILEGGEKRNIPGDAIIAEPLQVIVYDNFERAVKIFRSLVQSDRILSLYKEKQKYEKPSDKKRRKHNETMQRLYEEEIKQQKIMAGTYEKEKQKKLAKKEHKQQSRDEKRQSRARDFNE